MISAFPQQSRLHCISTAAHIAYECSFHPTSRLSVAEIEKNFRASSFFSWNSHVKVPSDRSICGTPRHIVEATYCSDIRVFRILAAARQKERKNGTGRPGEPMSASGPETTADAVARRRYRSEGGAFKPLWPNLAIAFIFATTIRPRRRWRSRSIPFDSTTCRRVSSCRAFRALALPPRSGASLPFVLPARQRASELRHHDAVYRSRDRIDAVFGRHQTRPDRHGSRCLARFGAIRAANRISPPLYLSLQEIQTKRNDGPIGAACSMAYARGARKPARSATSAMVFYDPK